MFNNTQMFIIDPAGAAPTSGIPALESGNITLYSSVSNYINNQPINGTYVNTVSTATQVTRLQMDKTPNGYVYNGILADNEMFQPGNSSMDVTVVPRTTP